MSTSTDSETYFNIWHDKEMRWPKDGGVYIPVAGNQMCSPQRTLEKGQRLAAGYAAQGFRVSLILAPCMFSRNDSHTPREIPQHMIDAAHLHFGRPGTRHLQQKVYEREHGLSRCYM